MSQKSYDISVSGRKITQSWWGNAWQKSIESYSDYSNRLPRARTYLRGGRVHDLTIEKGLVTARVRGSRRNSYTVTVEIAPISEADEGVVQDLFLDQIDSVEALLAGEFPEGLKNEILSGDFPLFPTPDEIELSCSCPDWAYLCKHVGAVLYGIGVVFDDDPSLFFKLRQVDVDKLVQETIHQKLDEFDQYYELAQNKSDRLIDAGDLEDIFSEDL